MIRMKYIWLIAAAIFTFGTITACGAASPGSNPETSRTKAGKMTAEPFKNPIRLTFSWWGDTDRSKATLAAIDLWNSENPDIQVNGIPLSNDGYIEKLTIQLAGGNAPDLFNTTSLDIPNFSNNGLLLELTPYCDTYLKGVDKGLWKYYTNGKDDRIWGIPFGENANIIAFDKTKLKEYGMPLPGNNETWDSFLDLVRQSERDTDGNGKADFWGFHYIWFFSTDMAPYYLRQLGYENGMFTHDMKHSVFSDPKVIEAFRKFESVRDYCPAPGEMQLKEGQNPISAGLVAYQTCAFTNFPGLAQSTKDELDIIPYPVLPGSREMREAAGGICFNINARTLDPEAALKFAAFFSADGEAGKILGGVRGILPSRTQRDALSSVLSGDSDGSALKKIVKLSDFINGLGASNPVVRTPDAFEDWKDMYDEESQIYEYKKETLEQFFHNVAVKGDAILAQR